MRIAFVLATTHTRNHRAAPHCKGMCRCACKLGAVVNPREEMTIVHRYGD